MLSIVIPTLNAAATLGRTLDSVQCDGSSAAQIVVTDGGSADGTVALARARGCEVVAGVPGRGVQLARGAEAASEDWLLFLHADTRLADGWPAAVRAFTLGDAADRRAAAFTFALDDGSRQARWLEQAVALRTRHLGLPYGDQGLLLSRAFYRLLGGYRPLPLMEDVDLVRRIGRSRLVTLEVAAVTSAARYRNGYARRTLRNALCLSLYAAGVPPARIATIYG